MKVGKNVTIHSSVAIFNPENIEIGDNVRIDAFCVLSGGIGLKIGSHIHIACGNYFFAGAGIIIEDFVQIGARFTALSQSDDFLGGSLVGPCIPINYKPDFKSGLITLKRHVIIGVGVTVGPGVTVGEGVALGVGAFVKKDCEPWGIYVGNPAKKMKERSRKMLEFEAPFLEEYSKR